MMKYYTVDIDGIGPVLFTKSRRARHVVISIRTSKDIRAAVPIRVSFQRAIEFINFKKEWLRRNLAKIKQHEHQQQAFADAFLAIDKSAAKKKLTSRLSRIAQEHGFTYHKVSIRQQRTRWGSCSSRNNISLNLKLVLLPDELIDYVMLHELVHTRIHNHSRQFWAELDRHTGNAKVMAKRLRMNDLRLL
ncbi:MAG: M48 family metallopeptidase [Dehalococcoidales bacterium]|nr:M48 family metallopeptidase [Dehalococcoidales bacterium]